jgi:hypothetical protein
MLKEARSWFVSINGAYVVQSQVQGDRAYSGATRDEANSWLIANSFFRAMCTATKLMLSSWTTRWSKVMIYDWLWTHCIRAMCTATELISSSCTTRSSSWLIKTHLIRPMCTATKLINDYAARSSLSMWTHSMRAMCAATATSTSTTAACLDLECCDVDPRLLASTATAMY